MKSIHMKLSESVLVQVADAVSGGRPGVRRDTVDRYITHAFLI